MSLSLTLGCLWVLAAAVTAMLPYARQFPPGITLLVAAPLLLAFIGWEHGWGWAVAGTLAFASMFRNPLIHMVRWCAARLTGHPAPVAAARPQPEDRAEDRA